MEPKEKIIKFKGNPPKLHNQTEATLVYYTALAGCQLKNLNALFNYDTLKEDGTHYSIAEQGRYFLLFFVGNKGIMFSTLRKINDDNFHYTEEVNQKFLIERE